jgi:hypothetical protein
MSQSWLAIGDNIYKLFLFGVLFVNGQWLKALSDWNRLNGEKLDYQINRIIYLEREVTALKRMILDIERSE